MTKQEKDRMAEAIRLRRNQLEGDLIVIDRKISTGQKRTGSNTTVWMYLENKRDDILESIGINIGQKRRIDAMKTTD